ncbi:MAG: DUF1573 domain-containing protein [Bacteroidetes bacterium]|jgi:uncharacterized membrane protein|nr:DUF1573 domain-containing protein [Bacteroidota bacterium]
MKSNFLLTAVLMLVLLSCKNEKNKHQDLVNKITKDSSYRTSVKWLDTLFDLGTINSGDKKEVKFRCLNTGNKPLVLFNVSPSCGCTIASYTDGEIQPQKEGWVAATFSSKGQCDDVVKTIIVTTNAKPDSTQILTFKAHIIGCESNDRVVPRHKVEGE